MSKWCWCLENENGQLLTGWVQVGDYWYYLKPNGAMATGWLQDSNSSKWYYLNSNGQMQTGWLKDDNKWYYLNESHNDTYDKGVMVSNCTIDINGTSYTFDTDGVWRKYILSDKGADFIGSWEGFWEKADYDKCWPGVDKYMTIGYGTTKEARPDAFPNGIDSTCTIEQARIWLIEEGQDKAQTIKSDLDSRGIELTQNELDALISFAYNCGEGQKGLLGSTLYKNIVAGIRDSDIITSNFSVWNKSNGKVEPGLTRRRKSEASLFLNSDYTGNV